MAPPDARQVAAQIILRKPGIDQLTLQKVLYLVQAGNLVWHDEPAFSDDIQAYRYGPVVPWVEYRYRADKKGGEPIQAPDPSDVAPLKQETLDTIDAILAEYGDVPGTALAKQLKGEGTPWSEARAGLPASASSQNVLALDSILRYHRLHGIFRPVKPTSEERRAFQGFLAGDSDAIKELLP